MALEIEGAVDRAVGGNEALGLALGFEALHLPLSSSDRKMGILDPVVVAKPTRSMAVLALLDEDIEYFRSEERRVGKECRL